MPLDNEKTIAMTTDEMMDRMVERWILEHTTKEELYQNGGGRLLDLLYDLNRRVTDRLIQEYGAELLQQQMAQGVAPVIPQLNEPLFLNDPGPGVAPHGRAVPAEPRWVQHVDNGFRLR